MRYAQSPSLNIRKMYSPQKMTPKDFEDPQKGGDSGLRSSIYIKVIALRSIVFETQTQFESRQ